MTFLSAISRYASRNGTSPALILPGDIVYTYSDLARRITELKKSVKTEAGTAHPLILEMDDPFEYVAAFVAAISFGSLALPFPTNIHHTERLHISQALEEFSRESGGSASLQPYNRRTEGDLGQVLHFTSGSFGPRKLVLRSYENLLDEASAVAETLGLSPADCILVTSPLSHSFGCGMMRAAFYAGAALAVSSAANIHARLLGIRSLLGGRIVSVMTGVPYIFHMLLRGDVPLPGTPVTRCYAGGAPLTPVLSEAWQRSTGMVLRQEYGLGEGGIVSFGREADRAESIGRPISRVTLEITSQDDSGIGQLVVRRPFAPWRYLVNVNNETFSLDGSIRTGDLARVDKDGCYYLTGRLKSCINVAGLKVSPELVEMTLLQHPGVHAAAVVGIADSLTGERPVAFVQLRDGNTTEQECLHFVAARLSRHQVPKYIHAIQDWPLTESGKTDYKELMKLL